jgi:hypothetical protein
MVEDGWEGECYWEAGDVGIGFKKFTVQEWGARWCYRNWEGVWWSICIPFSPF